MNKTTNQAKKSKNLGNLGEKIALQHLLSKGYRFIMRNYNRHWGELDLVMKQGEVFVFVEVKTRRNSNFGPGEESVDRHKKRKLLRVIHQYIENNIPASMSKPDVNWRLDLIVIEFIRFDKAKIKHFKDILGEE